MSQPDLHCPRCRSVFAEVRVGGLLVQPLACPLCLDDGLAVRLVVEAEVFEWPGDDEFERDELERMGGGQ